ncbi:MAG: Scr1 family TA system antitoxin-like transcriptional regulator, partial [Pseudonocardiaceae bacterium]
STVSVRVMPFSAGLHHGILSGPFEILRFPLNGNGQGTEPPTVYVEGFTGALYLDKPREIDHYDSTFTNIWVSSLDERASQELITQMIRELGK